MTLAAGRDEFGPEAGCLIVRTYREGVAAMAGHDLVVEVSRWEATLDVVAEPSGSTLWLKADSRSLEVREGLRGVKPLTDKDRVEIGRNIEGRCSAGSRSSSAPAPCGCPTATGDSSSRVS